MHFSVFLMLLLCQVFVPVCFHEHWTVYCINKVHNQIDILDPMLWLQDYDQHNYHGKICGKIQERLHQLLHVFTNGSFPDISEWGMPYARVPKQKLRSNDCSFFCMIFFENYIPWTRGMDIAIDKVSLYISYSVNHDCVLALSYSDL
jgi:hypothetical protein